jgi:site-specific recombinase XerC
VVRQYPQSQHPARLRERDPRLHAVHRHRQAGKIPHRDPVHAIAWRDDLARRELGGATIRHRHAALSSLFEYLCEKNAVTHNPVKGVKRPKAESGEGKTSAIGDPQARELLAAPGDETIKEKRDRAILSTLLYHALRREELWSCAS